MTSHFDLHYGPPLEKRQCYYCGLIFMEMKRTDMDIALRLPPHERCAAVCINCDPAAESNDYRVVSSGKLG